MCAGVAETHHERDHLDIAIEARDVQVVDVQAVDVLEAPALARPVETFRHLARRPTQDACGLCTREPVRHARDVAHSCMLR